VSKSSKGRVSPALVISIVALVLAAGGTSLAAAPIAFVAKTFGLTSKQKKQVKSIADTEIKSHAPKLSVLFANSAGSASTAGSAATAGNAASATNATHALTANSAAPSGAAGGSLSGTYPAPTLAAGSVGTSALAGEAVTPEKLGALPAVILSNSTEQGVTNEALTTVTFDTAVYDPLGMRTSASLITIQRSGLYLVTDGVNWGNNATGFRRIQVERNGNLNDDIAGLIEPASSGITTAQSASGLRRLNAGDTLQLVAEQSSGSTLAVHGITPDDPLLETVWLGP
jgi:hypothetical protein